MTFRVIGISSKNGAIHEFRPMASKGKFQLHFGKTADERKKNFKLYATIEEAIVEIRNGSHPRMTNISQRGHAPDIMSPMSIIILKKLPDGNWKQEPTK